MSTQFRQLILELTRQRGPRRTICPSEVARSASPEDWRRLMPEVRAAAEELAREGCIEFLQRGQPVDPSNARGPVRLRILVAEAEGD